MQESLRELMRKLVENVKLCSEMLMEKRAKLAGHIMGMPQQDPLRRVS